MLNIIYTRHLGISWKTNNATTIFKKLDHSLKCGGQDFVHGTNKMFPVKIFPVKQNISSKSFSNFIIISKNIIR